MRRFLPLLLFAAALIPISAFSAQAGAAHAARPSYKVKVPAEDRFAPFAITIHAGSAVQWVNNDEDDHTVVSDDAFDTTGHKGTNELLPADGGTITLYFNHPGTFVYYCRFHGHLDQWNQPVAPGPDGGIQGQNGNFGTPMSGVITVLAR